MKTKILFGVQIVAGLLLVVFGLSKFLDFMPTPPVSDAMGAFMGALMKTGYMMPLVGAIQVLSGVAFVLNRFVPLVAIVIAPVMINAVLAHLFLDPQGVIASAVILVLIFVVMLKNKEAYASIFKA